MKPSIITLPGLDTTADSGRWNGFDSPVETPETGFESALNTPEEPTHAPIWGSNNVERQERLRNSFRKRGHMGAPPSLHESLTVLGSRNPDFLGSKSPGAYMSFIQADRLSDDDYMYDDDASVYGEDFASRPNTVVLPQPRYIPQATFIPFELRLAKCASRIPRWSKFLHPSTAAASVFPPPSAPTAAAAPAPPTPAPPAPTPVTVPALPTPRRKSTLAPSTLRRKSITVKASVKLKPRHIVSRSRRQSKALTFFAVWDPETGGMVPFKGYQLPRKHLLRPAPGPGLPSNPKAGLRKRASSAKLSSPLPHETSLGSAGNTVKGSRDSEAIVPSPSRPTTPKATQDRQVTKRKSTASLKSARSVQAVTPTTRSSTFKVSPSAPPVPGTPASQTLRNQKSTTSIKSGKSTARPVTPARKSAAASAREAQVAERVAAKCVGRAATPARKSAAASAREAQVTDRAATKSTGGVIPPVARPTTPARKSAAASAREAQAAERLSVKSSAATRKSGPSDRSTTKSRGDSTAPAVPALPLKSQPAATSRPQFGDRSKSTPNSRHASPSPPSVVKTATKKVKQQPTASSTPQILTSSRCSSPDSIRTVKQSDQSGGRLSSDSGISLASSHAKSRSLPSSPPAATFLRPSLPTRSATDGDQSLVGFPEFLGAGHPRRGLFREPIDGDKLSNRNFSILDDNQVSCDSGFFENPELCSPPEAFNFWDLPGHFDCDPNLPSRFSTSTTSTSNYIDIDFPPEESARRFAKTALDKHAKEKRKPSINELSLESLAAHDLVRSNTLSPVNISPVSSPAKSPPHGKHASLLATDKPLARITSFMGILKKRSKADKEGTVEVMTILKEELS